jgi:hypothetical protein
MKTLTSTIIASLMASGAMAGGHDQTEAKDGPFINGTFEIYIDDTNTEGHVDTRFEAVGGYETELEHPFADWAGFSAKFDTNYALDRKLDNTITEKQMGLGIGGARLYIGETDVQRLGFAKTSKIGAPVIITKKNSRIDHQEKIALTFGGWGYNDEFEFNSYRLQRDMPYAGVVAWDPETKAMYYGVTARAKIVDVSYMQIDTQDGETQKGMSIGTSLHRMGIPIGLGYEQWEDKENTRKDYGIMYNYSKELMFTAHNVTDDDLGFTYNYLAAIHTKGPVELGLYYHNDKVQVNPWTRQTSNIEDSVKATIKYKF